MRITHRTAVWRVPAGRRNDQQRKGGRLMGVHYCKSVDGKMVEQTREEFLRFCEYFHAPIWESVIRDLDICSNCWCTDCGCCVGCGGINADIEGWHGYGCVM